MSLERCLDDLAECGICLREGVTPGQVGALAEEAEHPCLELLLRLGNESLSDSVLRLDTECVTGPQTYARLLERLRALTREQLPLSDVQVHLDLSSGAGWVSFLSGSYRVRWELEVNDDWLCPSFFANFALLLRKSQSPDRIYRPHKLNLGQEELLVCCTIAQKAALERLTGVSFQELC